jgi:hypothetical protein
MEFNIRAISLAESVPFDARTLMRELLGKEVHFHSGITLSITLPTTPEAFASLPDAERLLSALDGWTRVYDYPEGEDKIRHILAPAEGEGPDDEILVYRLDLLQPVRRKPGPRPPVVIRGGAVMTYDACAKWLINLFYRQARAHSHTKGTVLMRPRVPKPPPIKIGWVGAETIEGVVMPVRLSSIGTVFGAEIMHVSPLSFAHVKRRLAGFPILDAVALCTGSASYITTAVAPVRVPPDSVSLFHSTNPADIEDELIALIKQTTATREEARKYQVADESAELLHVMLRGMISHSKIGPFNHCTRETVLKRVRARRLNVPAADQILDQHCEAFQDTKTSERLFLWKDHNDGRQYFLNPKKVEYIKALIEAAGR